jgi:hypothetical protein
METTIYEASDREPLSVPTHLDALLACDADTLRRLYRSATLPKLSEVRGDLRGRMLALAPGAPGLLTKVAHTLASTDWFPWRGKSFMPPAASGAERREELRAGGAREDARPVAERGEGINRVISDRWKLYRFETFVGPSLEDGRDAIQLDYDHKENPFFIRVIKDEIRELAPGLWLGQAWLNVGQAPKLALYFGLTSR